MAGLNGDPTIQVIQITVSDGGQKAWGPQGGETASRAMLVFFNGAGVETGRFFFPFNAPAGQNTILIATTNFAALPGAPIPDFIIPPLISPGSGKVCFRGNPANRFAFDVNLCLSYGNFPSRFTEGAGNPAPALSISGEPVSLERFQNFGLGQSTSRNADFALASPTPVNTRGQTMIFAVDGPEIELLPSTLNFGQRNFDAGPTASQTLTITNRGVLNPLNITNVTLTGTNANQFRIVSDTGQTTLPPGGTRRLVLNFDPDTPGAKIAVLRVISDDPNETVSDATLRGIGVDPNAPEIDITPLRLTFASRDVAGGSSATQNVAIVNQGAIESLILSNLSLAGTHANQFRIVSSTNGSTLSPGGSRVVGVTFDPDSAGPKAAMLRIISSDTDEGFTEVALEGKAFDLDPCTAPNPTNTVAQNFCTNAQLFCPGFIFTGSMSGATPDGSSTCDPAQSPDVWYRYLPASNGLAVATVSPIGLGFQALSAHLGCPGTIANELGCGIGSGASFTIPVTNGVAVFFRLVGVASSNAIFQLTLEGPACFDFDQNQNGITDSCELDFGDAPAPYPTMLTANGARHRAFSTVFLGNRIDPDADGQPAALAVGDNLDGPPNDEDGVTFTSALVVGQTASLSAVASASGFLNGWIDFNADGDWTDVGEHVVTNHALVAGANATLFTIPSNAAATNLTFARFRFNSSGGLNFTGTATDGEVEDYAVEILPQTQSPGQIAVRINEVMAGLNGDSSIQFVEMEAAGAANKAWGPQGIETRGRTMLVFFDQAGKPSGRFVFPSNAPAGADTVLIATRAFAEATGITPDFVMPPEVVPLAGKVAFQSNPDNRHFDINIALSYGGNGYFGATDGSGPANTNELPVMHAKSLRRVQEVPFGLNRNASFQLGAPTPVNTAGQTISLPTAPLRDQGRTLFTRETFRGNGRTCATCHVPGKDQFGLTPLTIATLPEEDPLFVFEANVNTLRLVARSQPSDLRGAITGTSGNAVVLAGSGDTYLVVGGTNLSGTITDPKGNTGNFRSATLGDLNGPTASNGSTRGLEDHELLEHGRGLILENIDGFQRGEVFRASPHLLNLALTAPFGLSGEFSTLEDFSDGAVVQHFPKSLARVSGVDFRHPTREELEAMTAFMVGISNPSTNALNLDRLATTEAQKRGRAMFFGDEGRCFQCHSGPVLALSDGSLPGSVKDVNENFDTGVANLARNLADMDNLPTEPAGLTPGQSTRKFNTPSLFNIRLTAPFFHDGSAATLADAVKFYDEEEFHNSPAGADVGSLLAANKTEKVADMVAFLESLVELPVDFTRELAFGLRCPGQPMPGPMTATITNISSRTVTITNVFINGANATDFLILSDSGQTNLAPGQTRSIVVRFSPAALGRKSATLEMTGVDTNLLGTFSFGIALTGADLDNLVQAAPTALDFGTRDIDAPPSPEESIVITNAGSTDLEVVIEMVGSTPGDFTLVTETNAIPAQGTRVMQVSFAPRTQGTKSATVRIRMLACSGTLIEIALAGIATSTVHHFAWDPIGSTQFVGTPFPVRLTAQDRNGETVQSFRGTVRLMSVVGTQTNTVLISPTNSTPFVSGVWSGSVSVQQPAALMRLLARDNPGHIGFSDPFAAALRDDLSLTVVDSPDPLAGGRNVTYILNVHNTGPAEATGVVLRNTLAASVNFISGSASRGSFSHSNGVVTCLLGSLARAESADVTLVIEPNPPASSSSITNVASVTRNEMEAVLANNVATNTTLIVPFGVLTVIPLTNFTSIGLSGGPFTPTNQTYSVSNSGTAQLNWSATFNFGCSQQEALVSWWRLDGTGDDALGINPGVMLSGGMFTPGFSGLGLATDGTNNVGGLRVPASSALDVGVRNGLTIDAWIKPSAVSLTISDQDPIVEFADGGSNVGVQLWISIGPPAGGGPGSVFANLLDINNDSHFISSAPNLVVANTWQHVAVSYDKLTGLAVLYLNGITVAQTNLGTFTPHTAFDMFIGRRPASFGPQSFTGSIDEVAIYNRNLSPDEMQSIFRAGAAGKCASAANSGCVSVGGAVGWWPLNGNTADLVGTNAGVLVGNPAFTNGFIGQTLFFDGTNDAVRVPVSPSLNIGASNGFTFEAWINVPNISRRNPVFEFDDGTRFAGPFLFVSANTPGSLHGDLTDINNTPHTFISPPNLFGAGVWTHIAITYNRTNGIGTLYVNGASVHQQNLGTFTLRTTGDLFIGQRAAVGAEEAFEGLIDEPGVYARELTQSEIQSIFLSGVSGKCADHPGVNCASPSGLASWWRLDANTFDFVGTSAGIISGNPMFTNGLVGQALAFDGTDDLVRMPASATLNVGTNEGFTIEGWINVPTVTRRGPIFEWNDGSTILPGPHLWVSATSVGSLFASIVDTSNVAHQIVSPPNLLVANTWQHVALSYNRITGIGALHLNGANVQQQNLGTFTPKTGIDFFLGHRATPSFLESLEGLIDEPGLYRRALTDSEIQSIFAAGAAGKCRSARWFALSNFSGSLAPGATTNVNLTLTTNALQLAVGDYSDSIRFTNRSNGRGTTDRTVSLAVVNRRPTLGALSAIQVSEDSGTQTLLLSGIGAGGSESQMLTVFATSSNPGLIPNPITVSYTSPATNGMFSFTPLPNANGTSVVSVTVRDDASTEHGGSDAVTNSFLVTVTPENDAPTLAPVANQSIAEGGLLMVTNLAGDVDLPQDQLTFSLIDPPAGASVGPSSGLFNWTPNETQGPGSHPISVVVSDNGSPPLKATNRFVVAVSEVNSPPVLLSPLSDITVHEGASVSLTAFASDPDVPVNLRSYSLGTGAPVGSSINAANGAFNWTPTGIQAPSTNPVTFVVTDNGVPPLSDSRTIQIRVVPRPVIQSILLSGTNVTIRWSAVPGTQYRVLFKSTLDDQQAWVDLPGDVSATANSATKSDLLGLFPQRFYRVRVLP